MLHSTQLPASSSKYVPGSHAIVGITVGAGEGAIVVGRLDGAWVQEVPIELPVLICQPEVTPLERASTSVGTSSQSCGLGVGSGIGVRVSVEG